MPATLARAIRLRRSTGDDPVQEAVIEDFKNFFRKTQQELGPPQIGNVAKNLRFTDTFGSLTKRAGRAKYGGMSTLGTSKITFAGRYYKSSTSGKKLIIAYDTTLKVGTDSTGAFTNIKTGLTADQQYTDVTYKNLYYLFNGTDTSQVFDLAQTATENIGVPTPGAPTVAVGAAGVLNAAYLYKITYQIDSYQEGNAGTASASVSPSSQKVELTAIPTSANTRVTHRHIYRTLAGGAIYYFLATISDNTTTTYSDNTADGSLDQTRTAPTDYGAPDQNYKYGVLHNARIFQARGATDKSKVIYCDIRSGIAYPDVYPVNNFFYVTRDDGEEITFIGEDQYGHVTVMKANAIVRIDTTADSPVGWSGMNNILSRDGCISPYSAKKTHLGIVYVGGFGEAKRRLMLWDGSTAREILPELEPILSAAARSANDDFVGAFRDGFYYLTFRDATSTSNTQLLIIDLVNMLWTLDEKNVQCFSVWSSKNDFGELYTGSSDTVGFVLREDTSVEDVIVDTKSELDAGTYQQTQSGGTEANPTLVLIQAQLTDDIGAKLISAATDTISDLTSEPTETIAPSGDYVSEVFEVNAVTLGSIFWNEVLGTYGEVLFWVRTGDTLAAIAAAAWSGPYTTPSGSSLAAVTARKYIQFKCQLYVTQADTTVSEAPNVYLQLGSGYVVKITLGQGSQYETTIAMEWESSWLDMGWQGAALKTRRKQLLWGKVEFERTLATGNLTLGWRKDGEAASSRRDTDYAFSTYASQGYFVHRFPLVGSDAAIAKRFKVRLYHADDVSALTIRRVTLGYRVLPQTTLF